MSNQSDQRFVLDLLETGKIDTSEADWLLETLRKQPAGRDIANHRRHRPGKIILEIDADQENLQMVIEKLNQAICPNQAQNHKKPLLQRLTRRTTQKSATH
jgi:hypothetical protein